MLLLCKISENEINVNNSDTRERGGRGGGSNTMADYYAEASLQIRPSESLNVCEQMNVTEMITIAPAFDLLSCNSSMLVKETSDTKSFINHLMPDGNKKVTHTFCVTFLLPPGIKGLILLTIVTKFIQINDLDLLKFFPADNCLF